MPSGSRKSWIAILAINILWAPVNFMIRVANDGGFSPIGLASLRWIGYSIMLTAFLKWPFFVSQTRAKPVNKRDAILALLNGALFFGPSHVIYYFALHRTSTVEGTVLLTTAPVWTAFLAYLVLREHIPPNRALAIGLGFGGAWLVSIGLRWPSWEAGHTAGNLWFLGGVLAECLSGVIGARLVRRSSGIGILRFQVLGAALMLSALAVLLPTVFPFSVSHSVAGWLAFSYMLIVACGINFSIWFILVERIPLSLLAVTMLIQPPISAFLGWKFLGESLGRDALLGSALIFSALMVAVYGQRISSDRKRGEQATAQSNEGGHNQDAGRVDRSLADHGLYKSTNQQDCNDSGT